LGKLFTQCVAVTKQYKLVPASDLSAQLSCYQGQSTAHDGWITRCMPYTDRPHPSRALVISLWCSRHVTNITQQSALILRCLITDTLVIARPCSVYMYAMQCVGDWSAC